MPGVTMMIRPPVAVVLLNQTTRDSYTCVLVHRALVRLSAATRAGAPCTPGSVLPAPRRRASHCPPCGSPPARDPASPR